MDPIEEIMGIAFDRICGRAPYLAAELHRLRVIPDGRIDRCGTDGTAFYADPEWARQAFLSGNGALERAVVHSLTHVLLGHVGRRRCPDAAYDLHAACVLADEMPWAFPEGKSGWFRELRRRAGDFRSPEEIKADITPEEAALLRMDSHVRWDAARDTRRRSGSLSGRGAGKRGTGDASGALRWREADTGAAPEEYGWLLRRFMTDGEDPRPDSGAFDLGLYAYGLELFGDMPIVEPSESSERTGIAELAIAIDTSGSCSKTLTRHFLRHIRAVMKRDELFFARFRIHILQCDTEVRRDDLITDQRAFGAYIRDLELTGGGGTDFTPVFERIAALEHEGEFRDLKGLMYFSDGMGRFPKEPPDYETVFVMPRGRSDTIDMPNWVTRLMFELPEKEADGDGYP